MRRRWPRFVVPRLQSRADVPAEQPALNVTAGLRLNQQPARLSQWISNVTDTKDHYVFGHLDQTTVALTGRVNYTMTPNLSLQLYASRSCRAASTRAFKELVGRPQSRLRAPVQPVHRHAIGAIGDPDFNVKSFRTTNVLRWNTNPARPSSSSGSRRARTTPCPATSGSAAICATSSGPRRGTCFSSSSRTG